MVPTNNAGTLPSSGPTYGIISVNPAINASESILGILSQNKDAIIRPNNVIIKINRHKRSWLLSQNQSFSYIIDTL